MWYDELEKRNTINLPSDVTFGVEIEFAKASKLYVEDEIETGFKNNILNKNWKVENEETLMKVFNIFKDKFKDEFDFVDNED